MQARTVADHLESNVLAVLVVVCLYGRRGENGEPWVSRDARFDLFTYGRKQRKEGFKWVLYAI